MRCGKKWRLNFGSEGGEIDCFFASNLKFTIYWRTKNEEVHIWRKTHSRTHWLFCWKEIESRSLIRKRTAVIMNCTKISLSIKAFNRTALLYDVGARRHVKGESEWRQIFYIFLKEQTAVLLTFNATVLKLLSCLMCQLNMNAQCTCTKPF